MQQLTKAGFSCSRVDNVLLADSLTVIDYHDNIQDRRVVPDIEPGYLRKLLPSGPPEEGEPWKDIQNDIEAKIMPGITHWYSPRLEGRAQSQG